MKARRIKAGVVGVLLVLGLAVFLTRGRSPVPILWTAPAPFLCWATPVSDDGTVCVKGNGIVEAYDSKGKLKWTSPAGVFVDSYPVLGRDGTVYVHETRRNPTHAPGLVGTNEGIVALRPDGLVKWRFPISNVCEQPITGMAFSLDSRGTLYFATNDSFLDRRTLMAIGPDGKERWHFFQSEDNGRWPPLIEGDRVLLLTAGTNNSKLLSLDVEGKKGPELVFPGGVDRFSPGANGIFYVAGMKGVTLTAISATGSNLWEFRSALTPERPPTIGPDGSLYLVTRATNGGSVLVALSKSGEKKWEFALGQPHGRIQHASEPPAIASDGTLFVVSEDPKVTALNPDGTLRWEFRPRKRISWRFPRSWDGFEKRLEDYFGDDGVWATPPTLTTSGILYVGFGGAYDRLYALNVGVGLATNSPWPMRSGNARLTREASSTK